MKFVGNTILLCLILCFGTFGHPVTSFNKKNATDEKHNVHEKKGTIRIAGPWHSDAALDRNVDIGEDAYVRKIISSNEGINLNKDMAEAGEMFEVNGIDDFYDKNALITYEVNGHEVPVHMRPRLTPQSKSLFPEYIKDSPGEMGGFTRDHKGTLHGYTKKVKGIKLTPSLTPDDLPEYRMGRYTGRSGNEWKSLQGLKEESDFNNAIRQNKAFTKMFAKQLPVLSQLTRRQNSQYLKKSNTNMTEDDKHMIESLKHHVPRSHNYHRHHEPKINEDDEVEPSKEAALFQNLDTLHKKLERDKEENEAELRSMPDNENMTPKKQKAKARILNLLGELTEKLKGMESMISAHRDKKVEKFMNKQDNDIESSPENENDHYDNNKVEKFVASRNHAPNSRDDFDNEQKDVAPEHRDFAEVPQESDDDKIESMSKMGDQFKDGVAKLHQGLDEELTNQQNNAELRSSQQRGFEEQNPNEMLVKSFEKIGSNEEDQSHNIESNQSEMTENYHSENRPVVMDTKAIDYNADEDENESGSEKNDSFEETLKPHHRKFFGGHERAEKYKFFKKANKENEFDDDEIDNKDYRRRHGNTHHHHRYADDDDDSDDDESRHHNRRQHKKTQYDDDNDMDAEVTTNHPHHHNKKHFENREEESATDRDDVEESLADADEKDRRRTFKPKATVPTPAVDFTYPDYNEVKDAAIFETNLIRKKYHAKNVHWSDRLSDRAQKTAESLAGRPDITDKTLNKFREAGESLAIIDMNAPNVGKAAPDLWAREAQNFNFVSPQITDKNIDFAQMVWKSDNEFGLGVAKSKIGNNWIVTSAFDAPVVDRFKDLRYNVESDIPMADPYSDITG